MEGREEPWSWALETSSARAHDFHPGVGLRREGASPSTMSHQDPLLVLAGASHRSAYSLETGEGSVYVSGSEFWVIAWLPLPPLPRLQKRPVPGPSLDPLSVLTSQILPWKQLALPHQGCDARCWSETQATKACGPLMKSLTLTQKNWTPTLKSWTQFPKTRSLTRKTSTLSLKTWTPAMKIWSPSQRIWTRMPRFRALSPGPGTQIPKISTPCLRVSTSTQMSLALSPWSSTLTAKPSAPPLPQTWTPCHPASLPPPRSWPPAPQCSLPPPVRPGLSPALIVGEPSAVARG